MQVDTSKWCSLCREGGQPDHFSSARRCAFESGVFSSENWQCGTALRLREMFEEAGDDGSRNVRFRNDDQSLGVLWVEDEHYIVGTWYKERGSTGSLLAMIDSDFHVLTLDEAESAIESVCRKKSEVI